MAVAATVVVTAGCSLAHTNAIAPRAAAPAAPYTLIQEPDAGMTPVMDLIDEATESVGLVIYGLADDAAVKKLIAARKRGLAVQVLLNSAYHGRATNTAAYSALRAGGVDVKWASDSVIVHQKTLIVDKRIAAVGTGNLMAHYYPTGRDAWIIDAVAQDVSAIATTFDEDFEAADSNVPPAAITGEHLLWSPGARPSLLHHIDSATRSVDITAEELSDQATISEIDRVARRGVACRMVLTDNPQWARAIGELTAAGCSVHLLPADPQALYMHEKSILVDGTTLAIGSTNLTTASLQYNRELTLQLDTTIAPQIISAVASTFDHDYQLAPPAASSTY
uniref:phospholipase D n=1 Tax=Mycolicibacterium sp. CBMA 213 TaxID=1968788 RepID=A0A1S6GKN4_9MYCO|nr:Cardiolipin synthase [Mycolicibacterium sp. CBMA 213]